MAENLLPPIFLEHLLGLDSILPLFSIFEVTIYAILHICNVPISKPSYSTRVGSVSGILWHSVMVCCFDGFLDCSDTLCSAWGLPGLSSLVLGEHCYLW